MLHNFKMKNCSYVNAAGKWVPNEHPRLFAPERGHVMAVKVRSYIWDVWWYYGNLVDYFRILLAMFALTVIGMCQQTNDYDRWGWDDVVITICLMSNLLLDAVDGPISRRMNQTSIIGGGLDWFADSLCQFALAVWCMKVPSLGSYFKLYIVLFSGFEIVVSILDFGVSSQGVYPKLDKDRTLPWYLQVQKLFANSYSPTSLSTWLANTMYPIGLCLRMQSPWLHIILAPPAFVWAWHEFCEMMMLIANWREISVTLHQQGIEPQRPCSEQETDTLNEVFGDTRIVFNKMFEFNSKVTEQTAWINLYKCGKYARHFEESPFKAKMTRFANDLLREFYPNEEVSVYTFGFFYSQTNSKKVQDWHFDYGPNISCIFVPLTELTLKNATQFVRGCVKTPMPASTKFLDGLNGLKKTEGVKYLQVCQLQCDPFVILKMYPGCCHRGINNTEEVDRIMFFMNVCHGPNPPEIIDGFYFNVDTGPLLETEKAFLAK